MARVWTVYREGFEIRGRVLGSLPLEKAISRFDLAPWRFFSDTRPEEAAPGEPARRSRVLVEIDDPDLPLGSAFRSGSFYESPWSPEEASRRLAR